MIYVVKSDKVIKSDICCNCLRNGFSVKVHAAFNVLDSDRDGFVTRGDFKKKFHNLNSKQIDVVFQR